MAVINALEATSHCAPFKQAFAVGVARIVAGPRILVMEALYPSRRCHQHHHHAAEFSKGYQEWIHQSFWEHCFWMLKESEGKTGLLFVSFCFFFTAWLDLFHYTVLYLALCAHTLRIVQIIATGPTSAKRCRLCKPWRKDDAFNGFETHAIDYLLQGSA